jgi:hypothetical protein
MKGISLDLTANSLRTKVDVIIRDCIYYLNGRREKKLNYIHCRYAKEKKKKMGTYVAYIQVHTPDAISALY